MGVSKAGIAYARGDQVDELDLALSLVGLAATATVLVSGGSSETVKVGAEVIKTARGMRLLSPGLDFILLNTARCAVRWSDLPHWENLAEPVRLLRPEAIRPLVSIAADLGRVNAKVDAKTTLSILRFVDGPNDVHRIADVAETIGPKVVGRLEFFGKAKFMRLGLRISRFAVAMMASLIGLLMSLGLLLASLVNGLFWRVAKQGLRRLARR